MGRTHEESQWERVGPDGRGIWGGGRDGEVWKLGKGRGKRGRDRRPNPGSSVRYFGAGRLGEGSMLAAMGTTPCAAPRDESPLPPLADDELLSPLTPPAAPSPGAPPGPAPALPDEMRHAEARQVAEDYAWAVFVASQRDRRAAVRDAGSSEAHGRLAAHTTRVAGPLARHAVRVGDEHGAAADAVVDAFGGD